MHINFVPFQQRDFYLNVTLINFTATMYETTLFHTTLVFLYDITSLV